LPKQVIAYPALFKRLAWVSTRSRVEHIATLFVDFENQVFRNAQKPLQVSMLMADQLTIPAAPISDCRLKLYEHFVWSFGEC
jgi:hypothetical protein